MPLPGLMICFAPSTSITSGVQNENVLSASVSRATRQRSAPVCAIEGDDERILVAVAAEDQEVVDERRRAAGAMLRQVVDVGLRPQHFAREVERRGAHVAEVDVDAVAVDDRRRARQAVLLVHDLGGFDVRADRLDVPENAAILRVDAQHAERDVAGLGGAGRRS